MDFIAEIKTTPKEIVTKMTQQERNEMLKLLLMPNKDMTYRETEVYMLSYSIIERANDLSLEDIAVLSEKLNEI